ncbi:hypothetical protein WG66_009625 [Moniliophthora roreri]|uniref:Uncharacterized protein n=1 Tax=Moniliophthora roreri TaxID=221103 RepID=A0A0W0F8I3_MONRR|nr:hypothetical protein WG66_009625 [Moniliophthora roreri]
MPDIIRWYATAEKLHRDILNTTNNTIANTEISRRENVYATTQIPIASTSATAMVPMNLPSAGQTREARRRHRRPNTFLDVQGITISSHSNSRD